MRAFSATSKLLCALVPSSANDRMNVTRSPVRCRLGGGAAHVNHGRLTLYEQKQAEVSNQTYSSGRVPSTLIGVQRRSPSCLGERVWSGASHCGLVRHQASLRLSLSCSSMGAYQKPSCVVTCHKQPEPIYGLRWSMPCLYYVFAPISQGICALPDYPGGRRRPLRRKPT